MSVPCGLPSGGELADWIRSLPELGEVDFGRIPHGQQRNPLWVAQEVSKTDPQLRRWMMNRLVDWLLELEEAATPSAALRALAQTPNRPGLVLTLNYDRLVEKAAAEVGREVIPIGVQDIQSLLNDGLANENGSLRVLHLHGSLDDSPESLVLDADGYTKRADDQNVRVLFAALLPYFNLCILGSSFEEQYLATVLQARRPDQPRHVIVCESSAADRIREGRAQISAQMHNVLVCDYPTGEHNVLEAFCERLVADDLNEAPAEPSVQPASTEADDLYVNRRLVDDRALSEVANEGLEIALALNRLEILNEQDLRAERRALVIGPPGGGKSLLLERMGRVPSAGERGVLVRMRDIRTIVGEAADLVADWVGACQAR
jgi:hypothetical protein